jgi:hypothetical protein
MAVRRVRVVHEERPAGARTVVTDAETGEEIRGITSLEIFQVDERGPMVAVIKTVGRVVHCDVVASAETRELAPGDPG